MIVVAVREAGSAAESRVAALAAAIGGGPAQLGARLAAAGAGPAVVATAADEAAAATIAAAIEAAGFPTLVLGPADVQTDATRFLARSPRFDGPVLRALSRKGTVLEVACERVTLVLRGTAAANSVETLTTRTRKLSLAKAALTQGLSVTKTVEKTTTQAVGSREAFLLLFAPGLPTLALREGALIYDGFGPLRQPSRSANFMVLAAELRHRCVRAVFDERLLTRAGQARLLGPTLSPEQHLDVAVALLSRALRQT